MTSVVWWLKDGRHQLIAHHEDTGVWQTKCGLSIADTHNDNDLTIITPETACGACMTADARKHIDAARAKHAGTTVKLAPNRYT